MSKKDKPEEAITHQEGPGRYKMVSRSRANRGISKESDKYFDHESDREMGDNDPNNRISRKNKK